MDAFQRACEDITWFSSRPCPVYPSVSAARRLVQFIDETQWVIMGADVKGDIYEGLLEKNAENAKSGAGQYFTPPALIKIIVDCVAPEPGRTIADSAGGTGGFLLAACFSSLRTTR